MVFLLVSLKVYKFSDNRKNVLLDIKNVFTKMYLNGKEIMPIWHNTFHQSF
jgi:hypothetical protein